MDQQPLVSVIVSSYNREKYVKRAIESVLNQTYKNIEFVIIDNGSTDKTSEIILEFRKKDSRIVILTNKINLGHVKSLNKGIATVHGKYVAIICDDDFWASSQKLEKQVDFLEKNSDYVLAGGGIIRIDKNGKEIMRELYPETDEKIRKSILLECIFVHPAVVFRKKSWEQVGGYNENIGYADDWDLWLKLGKIGKFYNFQEYFVYYLKWEGNISNRNIFYSLIMANKLRRRYRKDYTGFRKAILSGWLDYLYYLFPFKKYCRPLLSKIKNIILKYQ